MGKRNRNRGRDGSQSFRCKDQKREHLETSGEVPDLNVDIVIDGSQGEGGGQLVRTSVALSSIMDMSVRVDNIRHGRPKPGLQAQHSAGVRLVSKIANAQIFGSTIQSLSLTLIPKPFCSEHNPNINDKTAPFQSPSDFPIVCDVGTAGSTALVLQAALPAALRFLPRFESTDDDSGTSQCLPPVLRIKGGTTALSAPSSDYVQNVLVENLRLFGIDLKYHVEKEGLFPRGGGSCTISIDKSNCIFRLEPDGKCVTMLKPCNVTDYRSIVEIHGCIMVCGASYERFKLPETMCEETLKVLRQFINSEKWAVALDEGHITIKRITGSFHEKHLSMTIWAKTTCGTVLGASSLWTEKDSIKMCAKLRASDRMQSEDAKSMWPQTVAHVAATTTQDLCQVLKSGAVVDAHMADQLCIFMAMASGTSRLLVPAPTPHLLSVIDVLIRFGVRVWLEDVEGSPNKVLICNGLGTQLR